MATVSAFIAAILASGEVKNSGNTNTTAALRRSLVRALSRLSSVRAAFTEDDFELTTVVDQADYTTADSGFPIAAIDFEVVEFDSGSGVYQELEHVDLPRLRGELRRSGSLLSPGKPRMFAWWGGELMLAPAPATAATLRGWYHRDARRDEVTGNLIDTTSASDAYTNPWFSDGEDPLWNKVLEIYHLAFAVDAERASFYAGQADAAVRALGLEWTRRGRPGFQTAQHW